MAIPSLTTKEEVGKSIAGLYLSIVMLLVAFGVVMVYSASSVSAAYDPRIANDRFFFDRQLVFIGIGAVLMLAIWRLNYQIMQRFSAIIYAGTFLLLLGVLVAGTEANNAKRWLNIGFKFQPSEVAKIVIVICAATFASRFAGKLRDFKQGFIPAAAFIAPICALIIVQPDLGTSVFVGMLGFVVLIAGGLRLKHLGLIAGAVMPIVLLLMFFKFDHVQTRIEVFLNPEADPLGKGHQILQSWTAVGSGGFLGKGIGNSTQKLFYLPEEHTDFIFAILVEETGFIGGGILIFLFIALLYAGHRVSKHAPDRFGALLSMGMTFSLALQAAMNLAVVTGAVPTKGISLPFISYGGTGIVVALMQVGVVLSVARQAVPRSQVAKLVELDAKGEARRNSRRSAIPNALTASSGNTATSGPAPRPL